MKYFKKLIGERIYLSPQNNEEIEKFTEWLNDFETTDYIGRSSYITTLEGEKKYFEENLNKNYNFFIITLKEDKLIGIVGLENYDSINRTATLGIFIGDKDYRNEGYGTEAFSARIKYAFDVLGLRRIENGYFVNNGEITFETTVSSIKTETYLSYYTPDANNPTNRIPITKTKTYTYYDNKYTSVTKENGKKEESFVLECLNDLQTISSESFYVKNEWSTINLNNLQYDLAYLEELGL